MIVQVERDALIRWNPSRVESIDITEERDDVAWFTILQCYVERRVLRITIDLRDLRNTFSDNSVSQSFCAKRIDCTPRRTIV